MTQTLKNKTKLRVLGLLLSCSILGACSGDGWLGEDNEKPLEGERIPLFDYEQNVKEEKQVIDVTAQLRGGLPMRDVTPQEAAAIAATEAALREMERDIMSEDVADDDIEMTSGEDTAQTGAPTPAGGISKESVQEAMINVSDASVIGGFIRPPAWENEFWPQPGGHAKHAMQHLTLSGGVLEEVWSKDIGSGSSKELPLTAQPIIVYDKIFTMDSQSVVRGFDAETGRELWEKDIGKDSEDEAVIGGGLSFSGGQIFATNGFNEVMALDPYDGNIEWRTSLSGPARAAPSAIPGKVFVTTLDNRLIALNANDGSTLWDHQGMPSDAGLLGSASPAVSRDVVIPAYSSGEVYAIKIANGAVAWADNLTPSRRIDSVTGLTDIRALPVIDKGFVIAMSFANKLVAIDERTGKRIWQQPIGGSQTPWVAGNRIFVLDKQMKLYSLNRNTGAATWQTELPAYKDPEDQDGPIEWFGPVFAGGQLVLFSDHGWARSYDPVDGLMNEEWKTGISAVASPSIASGRLYVLSRSGRLTAWE